MKMMKTLVVLLGLVFQGFVTRATLLTTPESETLALRVTSPPQPISLGTNVVLRTIQFVSEVGVEVREGTIVWTIDYVPTMQFLMSEDIGGEPGYCFCGQMQDFNLFSDWKLVDGQDNIVSRGNLLWPTNGQLMGRLVFTNISLTIRPMVPLDIRLVVTLSTGLASDISGGFITDDSIGAYLSSTFTSFHSLNGTDIVFGMAQDVSAAKIVRPSYSAISSIKSIGDDMLITAHAEKGKKYMLQSSYELNGRRSDWYYGAGETVLTSITGELHFLVPKWPGQFFYRVMSVDNIDLLNLVEINILTPELLNPPQFAKAGKVEIRMEQKTSDFISQRMSYRWVSDTGESGEGTSFSPTFTGGVHWVKLYGQGPATDVAAFKWVMVDP
jgi:hypothetical protein